MKYINKNPMDTLGHYLTLSSFCHGLAMISFLIHFILFFFVIAHSSDFTSTFHIVPFLFSLEHAFLKEILMVLRGLL